MFKTQSVNTEVQSENQIKDFKKLSTYVKLAKGYRSIGEFAADCRMNVKQIEDVIHARITSYPSISFLQVIANNSEDRVSLKELKLACGYSLYENNDMEQIKNIQVRRGEFYYANFGDQALDSEYGGYRVVLVIQNNKGNFHSPTSIVIPLTSRKSKAKLPTHVEIKASESGLQYDSIISCEQVRCISKRRLLQNGIAEKIGECPKSVMYLVEVALLKSQGIVELGIDEQDVIKTIASLNRSFTIAFKMGNKSYTNNYKPNHQANPQMVFA